MGENVYITAEVSTNFHFGLMNLNTINRQTDEQLIRQHLQVVIQLSNRNIWKN